MNRGRRKFIQQAGLAALTAMPMRSLLASVSSQNLQNIGLIVNTIENELKKDWQATLRRVSEIGYKYVEIGEYFGPDAASFKKFLQSIKLNPLAGGDSLAQMKDPAKLNKMIDDALFMGKKYMVCYWPWMDNGDNKKADDFKKAADDLNALGEQCTKRGIMFAFHNHNKEFVPVEGYKYGYDVLMKYTDPKKVRMLLDLYWVVKANADPIEILDKYPNRIDMFHVKDMDGTANRENTCPGYGTIQFDKIFAHAGTAGVKYYTVEVERYDREMQCAEDSYRYLSNLKF